jgi:hypothetical protein
VLRYLARYTHRVAISNRRLIACDDKGVTFKWKDYRVEDPKRYKLMTLATHEFIRLCTDSATTARTPPGRMTLAMVASKWTASRSR